MKILKFSSPFKETNTLFIIFLSLFSFNEVLCQNMNFDFKTQPSGTDLGRSYDISSKETAVIVISNVLPLDSNNITIKSVDSSVTQLNTINLGKRYDVNTNQLSFQLRDLIKNENIHYKLWLEYSGTTDNNLFGTTNKLDFEITVKKENPNDDPPKLNENAMKDAAEQYFKREYDERRYFNSHLGIYLKENIVHIFIDQNGNFIKTPIPTTATQKYLYQFHLFYDAAQSKDYTFNFTWEGKYEPRLTIEKGGKDVPGAQSNSDLQPIDRVLVHDFEVIGPFTDNFKVKLTRTEGDATKDLIPDRTIPVAKLYHVSISTGLISTTLRNPQNIVKFPLANGDTTLVADDPSLRGVVTIFASFYPIGRSFLLTPSGGPFDPSRFAIQVGAQLNNNLAENFFLGLSHDFARGGSFSYGAHFGRRNFVAGKPDFKFGSEKFDLAELVVKKDWDFGFYFGVVIDVRVAFQLLGSIGNPQFQ